MMMHKCSSCIYWKADSAIPTDEGFVTCVCIQDPLAPYFTRGSDGCSKWEKKIRTISEEMYLGEKS